MKSHPIVDEIDTIDLNAVTASRQLLTSLKSWQDFPVATIGPYQGAHLVRARLLSTQDQLLHNISDHSYTQHATRVRLGRANHKRQVIFYARHDMTGALAQCRFMSGKNPGDQVSYSFSTWKPTKDIKVATFLNREEIKPILYEDEAGLLHNIVHNIIDWSKDQDAPSRDLLEFVAHHLRLPIHGHERFRYKITAAIANHVYQSSDDLAGLFYQSVLSADNFNFAIKPKFIDEYFEPVSFGKGTYILLKNGLKEVSFENARNHDLATGRINW